MNREPEYYVDEAAPWVVRRKRDDMIAFSFYDTRDAAMVAERLHLQADAIRPRRDLVNAIAKAYYRVWFSDDKCIFCWYDDPTEDFSHRSWCVVPRLAEFGELDPYWAEVAREAEVMADGD